MNSLDYLNSQNFPNEIIGGVKDNLLLDSALSMKNNMPIDTLLNYIDKEKPNVSEPIKVSDEEIDLSKSLLTESVTDPNNNNKGNNSNMNTIFIIILIVILIIVIIIIILYYVIKNKKSIKDKISTLSKAINDTYNSKNSKNTMLSNSFVDDTSE